MAKIFLAITICLILKVHAQETVLPAKTSEDYIIIENATIHVGNGQVISAGIIVIYKGKIISVADAAKGESLMVDPPKGTKIVTINAKNKHVYPGLILPISNLGLVEVSAVRATNDVREMGEMNTSVRSIVAYNAESEVINTLRSNGILLANIVPQGSLIAGSSSVVQLDAWNWEDAAYKTDGGMHLYMPSLMPLPRFVGLGGVGSPQPSPPDPVKEGLDKIDRLKSFFSEAKAYLALQKKEETNLKFEAVKGLFNKSQKLFVHANTTKQMLVAIDLAKEFSFGLVIVGGSDSWLMADLLKQNNVAVILNHTHGLPALEDDDVDQPYKTAALLQKAGVLFAISDDDDGSRSRNLAFNAGTAATYGLTKEEALQAITLNAAKILGVADKTGSIEAGKDANIVISEGDILDMRTSIVTDAFIQGRKIDLTDKHKQLNERYNKKYNIQKPF